MLTISKLFDGQAVFLNYFVFIASPIYKLTSLPGVKKGISGSFAGGFNLSISKYINEKQQKAAAEALKYITSKQLQKKYIMADQIVSGILSLYDDIDVCSIKDCEVYHDIQYIGKPKDVANYDEYSELFIRNVYDFLYGNKTAQEVLTNIDDLTRIYYISKDSKIGLYSLIVIFILIAIMIISLLFLFCQNFNKYFEFLSFGSWFTIVTGSVILLLSILPTMGKLTSLKCHLKGILSITGLTLNFFPILIKLIMFFPFENKISELVTKYKYLIFLISLIIDALFYTISLLNPYNIITVKGGNDKIFQKCDIKTIHLIIYAILGCYKFILVLIMLLFIFMEWNFQKMHHDLEFGIIGIYVTFVSIILFIILHVIKLNNYVFDFFIWECMILITSITNYVFFYGYRIIIGLIKFERFRLSFVTKINKNFIENETVNKNFDETTTTQNNEIVKTCTSETSNETSNKSSILSKIIDCHYNSNMYDTTSYTKSFNTYYTSRP